MVTFALLVAATLAARPVESNASARELRHAVGDALSREATADGADHQRALRELVTVYNLLQADKQLPLDERRSRLAQVRKRLDKGADKLARDAADRPDRAVAAQVAAPAGRGARAAGNARRGAGNAARGAAGGRATDADGARDLIGLIRNTIAPGSWDQRGGPGTIMYFPPKQVLVIRQTGEVHEQFEGLIRQLRR